MDAQEFSEKVEETQITRKHRVLALIDRELQFHNGLTDVDGFYVVSLVVAGGEGKLIKDTMVDRGFVDVEVLGRGLLGYLVKFKLPPQGE